jgi:hypothetical protein
MSADALPQGDVSGGVAAIFQHLNINGTTGKFAICRSCFFLESHILPAPLTGKTCSMTAPRRSPVIERSSLSLPSGGAPGLFPLTPWEALII